VPHAARRVISAAAALHSCPDALPPRRGAQDGKCLYTTVREFVENSLDAAEAIGVLPEVSITMCAPRSALQRAR
jgi:hypothetical protein